MEFRQVIAAVFFVAVALLILRILLRRRIRTMKVRRWWRLISDKLHDHQLLKVPEFNENYQENQLFRRVCLYLNSLEALEDADYTNLYSGVNPTDILLSLNPNQSVEDDFLGARLVWRYSVSLNAKSFLLRIRKRDKRRVLRPYLQHIHSITDEIEQRSREIHLYTNSSSGGGGGGGGSAGRWRSVPFTHPATLETIALDAEVKSKIKMDLELFLKSKQYYNRLGRVWRRSYLLHGPSGTGKSSFVAAMAKTLGYDVYDLDLTRVADDGELKLLLLQTTPRSIILVENFERYVNLKETNPFGVSYNGVLNFMDGVVNSCCDERVMVFTMTTKEDIDPSVLRPGRVDVHVNFPMCDFNNFKSMASNYLGVKEHKLFPQVEEMFLSGASLSPAEIGELMIVNRTSPSRALKSVISALQTTSLPPVGAMVPSSGSESFKGTPRMGRVSVDESGDPIEGLGCRDGGIGVKEIRKLYGLLRRKSGRKNDSFDLCT